TAGRLGGKLDLVLELRIVCLEGVEGAPEVGEDGLAALARVEPHVDVGGAEVGDGVGTAQIIVASTAADDGAHVEPRQSRQIGIVHRRHLHGVDGRDARTILAMASDPCSFLPMWVARPSVCTTTSMEPVCLVMMVCAP